MIDLVSGDQPFTNETGDVAVVANCEIYNFQELRADVAARGHELRGTNDVAPLPHLYEEYGLGFAERLEGMYAIALWDARRERLVLVRDRLGKKPLLWARLADGTLAFASELKALARLPGIDRTPDLSALDAYLALQYVPSPLTPFRGVEKVPPGCMLIAEDGEVRIERYWEPVARPEQLTEEQWLQRIRETVGRAVERRLVADVPLGVLLSGGIDSSIVASQVARAGGTVRTFSVGFGESRYDERPLARLVATRFGTEHREFLVEESATDLLPRLAIAVDEPLGDASALPTAIVCEHASRFVTVALTGDGGDEAFGGYERYGAVQLAALAGRLPSSVLRAAAAGARRLPGGRQDLRSPLVRAARFAEAAASPPSERYGRLMEIFPPALRAQLWTPEAAQEVGALRTTGELLGPPPAPGIAGLQLIDLATYLPGDLLRKADLTSMATSLELRSPFLDREVVELGLALPDSLKFRRGRGKIALRRAFASELPPEILAAPKRGFGVPLASWFAGPIRDLAGDVLLDSRSRGRGLFRTATIETLITEHAAGRADHAHRLWTLLMLELWHRRYADEVPAAAPQLVAARG